MILSAGAVLAHCPVLYSNCDLIPSVTLAVQELMEPNATTVSLPPNVPYTLLDKFLLYPINWYNITSYFNTTPDSYWLWNKIKRSSLSLHLYGHMTGKLEPKVIECNSSVTFWRREV